MRPDIFGPYTHLRELLGSPVVDWLLANYPEIVNKHTTWLVSTSGRYLCECGARLSETGSIGGGMRLHVAALIATRLRPKLFSTATVATARATITAKNITVSDEMGNVYTYPSPPVMPPGDDPRGGYPMNMKKGRRRR